MKKIGKYLIRGLLGRGGMGKVYKAQIPVIDKIVALKYLAPHPHLVHVLGNATIEQLFEQEAVIMAGIRHRYVASVLDFGEIGGHAYYIMEYHAHNLGAFIGETYRAETPSRPLPVDKTIVYTKQILSGLARLHLAGIVHRDLKPYNILIDDEEEVKICDFGLSRLRAESVHIPSQLKIGSPFYAAPEQESCPDDAGPPADLFSVGVMIYRMLTGTLPKKRLIPAHRFNSDLDPEWDAFLQRSLAPAQEIRFQSADQMADALNDLETQWENKKEAVCGFLESAPPPRAPGCKKPRSQPEKIPPDLARNTFDLDSRWRPKHYGQRTFVHSKDEKSIFDPRTSLLWVRSGWPYSVTWQEAIDIVDRMNQEAFGGVQNWRIPTIPEIISIMRHPLKAGDLCLAPDFDLRHRWLWSSDRRSFISHWYVNMNLGYVGFQDKTANLYVKAVASVVQRQAEEVMIS